MLTLALRHWQRLQPHSYLLHNLFARRFMASNSTVLGLPSPLRDLVAAASPNEDDYGTTDKDKAEIRDWISKVAEGEIAKPSSSDKLNSLLTPKTYVVGNALTAADVALYGALHPTLVCSALYKCLPF